MTDTPDPIELAQSVVDHAGEFGPDMDRLARAVLEMSKDREDAAGELLVDIAECAPGSAAGKLLVANRVLRGKLDAAREERDAARAEVEQLRGYLREIRACPVRAACDSCAEMHDLSVCAEGVVDDE